MGNTKAYKVPAQPTVKLPHLAPGWMHWNCGSGGSGGSGDLGKCDPITKAKKAGKVWFWHYSTKKIACSYKRRSAKAWKKFSNAKVTKVFGNWDYDVRIQVDGKTVKTYKEPKSPPTPPKTA